MDPEKQEIIRLLIKLKDANGAYPQDMLAARRQIYLKQMAAVGQDAGTGIKSVVNHAKNPNVSPITSTLLEGALVVAIVAEASTVAYIYRDKLAGLFQSSTVTPKAQEITSLPIVPTSLEVEGRTPSPASISTFAAATISVSPSEVTGVPVPDVVNPDNKAASQVSSTPVPNVNNGNHYGQTPKPARTKRPGSNNNNNNSKDNTDKNPGSKPPKNK